MFKKNTNKIILVAGLFLTFFCFNPVSNVFAYTEIFSEDFDSYNLGDGIDGKNGFYTYTCYEPSVSNDFFLSSPHSLKFDHTRECFNKDLTYDHSGVEDVYVELDVYLSGLYAFTSVYFDDTNSPYPRFTIGFDPYNGTRIESNSTGTMTIIDNNTSCSSSDYCQNWFNLGLDFHLDKITNTLYQSVYINNVLVETYFFVNYTSNLYTLQVKGNVNNVPVYIDNLFISDTIPPSAIDGVCGDLNGSTFEWVDDFNDLASDFCSAGDFYLAGDNGERIIYHCAGLNGGTTQYNCFADYYYDLDPTISDVIDFNFDDFTYNFEEGDVSKNWLIDVFKFLFLPREQTLQKFFTAFDNFKTKIPFGYIYLIQNKFKEVSLESTDEFALNLELLGEDYEVFSVTSLKQNIGENTFNIFYNTIKALIWIAFVLYLITRSRKLFNNND